MPVSAQDWSAFYDLFHKKSGLDLNLYKQDQIQRRILTMLSSRHLTSLNDFGRIVTSSEAELREFLDKVAINVSELYRNPEKWVEMEKVILPTLLKQSPTLKIWSAGCSYGAEAHTFAAILDAKFPGRHSVFGSDIDQAALSQARRGEFSVSDLRGLPAAYREKYFTQTATGYKANPSLTKYLTFKTGNLLADRFDTGYDLIACRNVVIYFNDEAKDNLYRKFLAALKPGGFLFVGSTERIFNSREIGFESPVPFFYQKPMQSREERQWRNAS